MLKWIICAGMVAVLLGGLVLGASAPPLRLCASPGEPEETSSESVSCTPLGLNGAVTGDVVVGRLTDDGEDMVFVGTSNGLYVVAPGGELEHFLLSPFGVRQVSLLEDVTGDGVREVVVCLDDADVPGLRCYDGATWEKIWHFVPDQEVFVENAGWTGVQFHTTDLETYHEGDGSGVLVTADRCIYSVDGRDGSEMWRFQARRNLGQMAVVADADGDGHDIAVGSEDGFLYLLDGQTGKLRWEHSLEQTVIAEDGTSRTSHPSVGDVLALDGVSARVIMASTDGWVRLVDLVERGYEWETSVLDELGLDEDLAVSLTPDVNDDGLPDILVAIGTRYRGDSPQETAVALVDSAGNIVWDKSMYVWRQAGAQVGCLDGQPVILETEGQELRLVDVSTGDTDGTIDVSELYGGPALARPFAEDSYLLLSDRSDLAVVSSQGETLWSYRRIGDISVQNGDFNEDGVDDVLFCCESGEGTGVRVLSVMDGATHDELWSYEVPHGELRTRGGLKGIQVTPDVAGGDGIQDVIAYRENDIFVFSGCDGGMSRLSLDGGVAFLDTLENGTAGSLIAAGLPDGLMILDGDGVERWAGQCSDWVAEVGGEFRVMGDINGDGAGDLVLVLDDRLVLLKSIGGAVDYEHHLTLEAGEGWTIEFESVAPDVDGDGVQELAYRRHCEVYYGEPHEFPQPVLLLRSPLDGSTYLELEQGNQPVWSPACGDFDGDGYADSIACREPVDTQQYYDRGELPGPELEIFSGRDGGSLWAHTLNTDCWSWPLDRVPAMPAGDINGDGADDLVCAEEYREGACRLHKLVVYDVAHGVALNEMPVEAVPRRVYSMTSPFHEKPLHMVGDLDGGGGRELAIVIDEPLPSPDDPESNQGFLGAGLDLIRDCLAVLGTENGTVLASFWLSHADPPLFDAKQAGILGMAAFGSVCFLDTSRGIDLTSPPDGSKCGPRLDVAWDGTNAGDFAEVFVDGARCWMGNGTQADLSLAPGKHQLGIRSIDDCGRICYVVAQIEVTRSVWGWPLVSFVLLVLAALVLLLFYSRLVRRRRWLSHRRPAG